MEAFARFISSKGWNWFWLVWSVFWFVFDVLTGSMLTATLMGVLALFWSWQLYRIYTGKNSAYNLYHGEKA